MPDNFLLIAHTDTHHLTLLDAATLQPLRQYEMPGRVAVLSSSSNSRYAFAVHRDDDCVTIIDPLQTEIMATIETGEKPTHFHAHAGHSIIFNDGSGDTAIFDESNLPHFDVYPAMQPDHGSALLIDAYLLVGYLRGGSVEVYRRGETEPLQTFDCCPVLHGATQVGTTALFGCQDGVLMLKPASNGSGFTMTKLNNPEDAPERVRVGLFATHPESHLAIGNFGEGLALIDTGADTMTTFSLPDKPLKFCFDPAGEHILALTSDGTLQQLSLNGDVQTAVPVTEPVAPPKGPDKKARPTFTIDEEHLYLIEPDNQELVKIALADFSRQQRVTLSFEPGAVISLCHGT